MSRVVNFCGMNWTTGDSKILDIDISMDLESISFQFCKIDNFANLHIPNKVKAKCLAWKKAYDEQSPS